MTRKRFVKLLMSTGDWDRNSANGWVKAWKKAPDLIKNLKQVQRQESFYSALWSYEVDAADLLAIGFVSVEAFTLNKDLERLDKETKIILSRNPFGGVVV